MFRDLEEYRRIDLYCLVLLYNGAYSERAEVFANPYAGWPTV